MKVVITKRMCNCLDKLPMALEVESITFQSLCTSAPYIEKDCDYITLEQKLRFLSACLKMPS